MLLRVICKRKDDLNGGLDVHGLPVDQVGLELPLLHRIDRRGLQQRGSAEGLDLKDFPARIDDARSTTVPSRRTTFASNG